LTGSRPYSCRFTAATCNWIPRNSPTISWILFAWLSIVSARFRDRSFNSSRRSSCAWPSKAASGLLISWRTRATSDAASVNFSSYSESCARRRSTSFVSWFEGVWLISFSVWSVVNSTNVKERRDERKPPTGLLCFYAPESASTILLNSVDRLIKAQ